jgi:hypothetical protein
MDSTNTYGPIDARNSSINILDPAGGAATDRVTTCCILHAPMRRRLSVNNIPLVGYHFQSLCLNSYYLWKLFWSLKLVLELLEEELVVNEQAHAYKNLYQKVLQHLPCQPKKLTSLQTWTSSHPESPANQSVSLHKRNKLYSQAEGTHAEMKKQVFLRLPDETLRAIHLDEKWTLQHFKDYIASMYTIIAFDMVASQFYLTVNGRPLRLDHWELKHYNLHQHACIQVNPRFCMLGGSPQRVQHILQELGQNKLSQQRAKNTDRRKKWRDSLGDRLLPEELEQYQLQHADRMRTHRQSLDSTLSQEDLAAVRAKEAARKTEQRKRHAREMTEMEAVAKKKIKRDKQRALRHKKENMPDSSHKERNTIKPRTADAPEHQNAA